MLPDDPRHGSVAGYSAHCEDNERPCLPCRAAKSRYNTDRYRLTAYGRWAPFVDSAPAIAHVRALMAEDMSIKRIAEAAGVPSGRISLLLYGRSGQPAPRRVRPEFSTSILAVQPDPWKISSVGAARRLQALACMGYNQRLLAAEIGTTQGMVWEISHNHPRRLRITVDNHDRIDAVYRRLCMTAAPETTKTERHSVSRTRNAAARKGWVPPLSWTNIDDPDEQPQGAGTSEVDRAEVLADVDSWGGNATNAARILGVERHNLQKWCQRTGHSELYRRLAAREAMHGNQWSEGAA